MNTLDVSVILVYLLAMLGLGYYYRDNDTKEAYFLGKKSFGWFAVGMSVMATQLSAVSFISIPAFVGARDGGGLMWVSTELHAPLTMLLLGILIFPPLFRAQVISIYAFLEQRLGPSTRHLVSLTFLFNRAVATGIMVYTVCLILDGALGLPFYGGLAFIGGITIIYSWQGGMRAVIYGDTSQMIILLLGVFACIYFGLRELGGWSVWLENIDHSRTVAVDFSALGIGGDGEFGFWPLLIGGMFISLAYYGTDQSEAQRLLASKDLQGLRRSLLFVGLVRYPMMCLYAVAGLVVGQLMLGQPEFADLIRAEPDKMIPLFITRYLPHGVIGLLIVAILAAAMSSLSSAVNSLSAVTTEGYLKNLRDREGGILGAVGLSRAASLVWGLVIILVATLVDDADETLIVVIAQIGSLTFGPILSVFLLAILHPRAGARGANAGLVAGIVLNVFLWQVVGEDLFWIWWNVTGTLAGLGVGMLVAQVAPAPTPGERLDLRPDFSALRGWETWVLLLWFALMLGLSLAWPTLLA